MASRVTWLVFPLFALYLLLLRKRRGGCCGASGPAWWSLLVVAALVALPLVRYLRAHPGAERRVGDMMEPIRELLPGKPQRVLRHTWNAAARLFLGGRPLLGLQYPRPPGL